MSKNRNTRRDFIKEAALLAGGASTIGALPDSIKKAMSINPKVGSDFYDAEHVVLLMQENRSFDHCFGTLQGVRGFNDPRAISLPNKNKIWFQSDRKGRTFAPFRLNIKDTRVTWMGGLPHSWWSMGAAFNKGKCDNWIEAKQPGEEYKDIPFTMGYYTREDLPFYYAMADAFTVCDHHFCSALSATTPNRVLYWTGTLREKQSSDFPPHIFNSSITYDSEANWRTFPELLEEHDISWKVYQNEISVGVGMTTDAGPWLDNFTNNPLEWFRQFHVRFHPAHVDFLEGMVKWLSGQISDLEKKPSDENRKAIKEKKEEVSRINKILEVYNHADFDKLSDFEKSIHKKAFSTNTGDPFYHEVESLDYYEEGEKRSLKVPKGDIFYQFRKDVESGNLPTVSWLIGPMNFSDHPGVPWYGAWYVSEALNILTRNPEVWKKTIFILVYDENDGFFDHVPPFIPSNPEDPKSGISSSGVDTSLDFITRSEANKLKGTDNDPGEERPIGLGFRVPLVIASPWSRGGWVNSEVCDNTSILMFLEKFLSKKTGKNIVETNISNWRRTVCGDLTSVFRPYNGEKIEFPASIDRNPFIEDIYNAKFKDFPHNYENLTQDKIASLIKKNQFKPLLGLQEKGVRRSCPLPYQFIIKDKLHREYQTIDLKFTADPTDFQSQSEGAPFTLYANGKNFEIRNYGVKVGSPVTDSWNLSDFDNGIYDLELYGPNGFYRKYTGDEHDPFLDIQFEYDKSGFFSRKLTGNVNLILVNNSDRDSYVIEIKDNGYKNNPVRRSVKYGGQEKIKLNLEKGFFWYDMTLRVMGFDQFSRRLAGHVENGEPSFTDPFMGDVI